MSSNKRRRRWLSPDGQDLQDLLQGMLYAGTADPNKSLEKTKDQHQKLKLKQKSCWWKAAGSQSHPSSHPSIINLGTPGTTLLLELLWHWIVKSEESTWTKSTTSQPLPALQGRQETQGCSDLTQTQRTHLALTTGATALHFSLHDAWLIQRSNKADSHKWRMTLHDSLEEQHANAHYRHVVIIVI